MRNRNSQEEVFDALLRQVAEEQALAETDAILEKYSCGEDFVTSPQFDARMRKLLARSRRRKTRRFRLKVFFIAAALLVVLVGSMSLGVAANRKAVYNFFFGDPAPTHAEIRDIAAYDLYKETLDDLETTDTLYFPTSARFGDIIPEINVIEGVHGVIFIRFVDGEDILELSQEWPAEGDLYLDAENGDIQRILVAGHDGFIRQDDTDLTLFWSTGTTQFVVNTSFDRETAIEFAESLTPLTRESS